jgi:hypothetical protein
MHRSGTSLLARVVQVLGVYLGPEEHLMALQPENPRGFWENRLLTDLNDEILARFGGRWDDLPPVPAHWAAAPEIADLRQRARSLIQTDFGTAKLWGWKDPRTCLTLPFWKEILPPMSYIICLRNPYDVAQSLQQRNGFSIAKGVDLWLAYLNGAIQHTAGERRYFLFYEDFLHDWQRELRPLAAFLGKERLAGQASVQKTIQEVVDASLAHHRTLAPEVIDTPNTSFAARALYMTLRMYVGRNRPASVRNEEAERMLQTALHRFTHWARRTDEDVGKLEARAVQAENAVPGLKADLAQKESHTAQLQSELADSRKELAHREGKLLTQQKEWEQEVQTLQAEVDRRDERVAQFQEQLTQKDLQLTRVEAELHLAQNQFQKLSGQIETLREQLTGIQESLLWPKIGRIVSAPFWLVIGFWRIARTYCKVCPPKEHDFQQVLIVGSASNEIVNGVIERLLERFPTVRLTALLHKALVDHAKAQYPVVEVEPLNHYKSRTLRGLIGLWRRKFDLTVVVWSGERGYHKVKQLAFASGPRYLMVYNENLDSFYCGVPYYRQLLRHCRWRWKQGRLSAFRFLLGRVFCSFGFLLSVVRSVPLILKGFWVGGSRAKESKD